MQDKYTTKKKEAPNRSRTSKNRSLFKRGKITLRNSDYTEREEYCYDVAQRRYEENQKKKEGYLKIGNHHDLANFIEDMIITERVSPYVARLLAKKMRIEVNICLRTLYNYIHGNLFLKLGRSSLIYKKKENRKKKTEKRTLKRGGESIEKRSEKIGNREELGHYEMDTVVSGKGMKSCLLVLTERVSRKEIIVKLPDKTSESVIQALKGLRRKHRGRFLKMFKSITSDNGSEFSNAEAVEKMGIKYFYAQVLFL